MSSVSKANRGSSLLAAMVMVTVILGMLSALISYAMSQRLIAVNNARSINRWTCAESGLLLARTYFSRNFSKWNTYLSQPNIYNPVQMATWNNPSSTPPGPANYTANSPLRTSNPELFIDIDGDGAADVYIYVRDNQDEYPPAADNPFKDNDQNVIVGAICISNTMSPPRNAGQGSSGALQLESMLSYNIAQPSCGQAWCGNGAGNMNDISPY